MVGLFCEDYPALRDRHLQKIRSEFPPWLGKLKLDPLPEFHLHPKFGGGVIAFRNLDDPSKYQSTEFAAIAVDELTKNEEQTFHDLRSRKRWPGISYNPFLAATNPGGVGHAWVYRFWVAQDYPHNMKHLAGRFAYIPAKVHDNPYLPEGYIETLRSLPDNMREALLEGRWDIFMGQAFPEFRPEIHVVKSFQIPSWWRRWRSNDPGYGDPYAWYWFAADQDGNVYVYREFTRENELRLNYSEQAQVVTQRSFVGTELPGSPPTIDPETGLPLKEEHSFTVTGMDAFNKHPETGKAIIDYYRDGGVKDCIMPVHGPGARANQKATLHEYLKIFKDKDGNPLTEGGRPITRLRIFSTCKKLIETLPALVVDPKDPEKVAESAIDHWFQAVAYGLQAWHHTKSTPPNPPMTPERKLDEMKAKIARQLVRRRKWGE